MCNILGLNPKTELKKQRFTDPSDLLCIDLAFWSFHSVGYTNSLLLTGKGRERGDDMQQRAAGRIRTRATAKDLAYMGLGPLRGHQLNFSKGQNSEGQTFK